DLRVLCSSGTANCSRAVSITAFACRVVISDAFSFRRRMFNSRRAKPGVGSVSSVISLDSASCASCTMGRVGAVGTSAVLVLVSSGASLSVDVGLLRTPVSRRLLATASFVPAPNAQVMQSCDFGRLVGIPLNRIPGKVHYEVAGGANNLQ